MVVLDTEVILRFYLDEEGSDIVGDLLREASDKRKRVLINIVNLSEIWNVLARKDPRVADDKVEMLRSFGVVFVPAVDDSLWRLAAAIKRDRRIPLADAFAAATAQLFGEALVVGDDEHFRDLGVELLRLPHHHRRK